ncbi:vicilin-like seed storage protein At2g18540 [Aristolochia californica]|uniref:vicilin-like seed storage protein At2g18540 n=1 Tax=Aristolochia californica TaxID=171875 RepID=UPI0035E1FFEC
MMRNLCKLGFTLLVFFLAVCDSSPHATALRLKGASRYDPLVTKESRRTLAETESGKISAVDVDDGYRGPYHLQFITLEPNSLFLPVLLQSDMILYVQTGRGTLAWTDDTKMRQLDVVRGDIYRLPSGSVFHVKSHAEPTRERLRIFAFFTSRANENLHGTFLEAYSTLTDLILGFDKEILQMAFNVPDAVIEEIRKVGKPPQILPMAAKNETEHLNWKETIIEVLTGRVGTDIALSSKKPKTFNLLSKKPDFENCNGRSVTVSPKDFRPLKGSGIGLFMVNLTKGSMMGPHWNPRATEIAIVTEGRGMVRVVCSSESSECNSTRIRVKEGDVFLVPRYHPMAQISFNNEPLVFVGFSTMAKKNYPQFLAGKRSVLRTLSQDIVAMSLNVPNATVERFLGSQMDSITLDCTSCAEAEEKRMEEEIQRQQRKREEKEARKREEEEKRKREEEEKQKREEEEKRKREEEEKQEQEEKEARRREEEEKQEQEEKEARRREEEEKQEQEEKEARRREEEEKQEQEDKEARRREEEEKQEQEDKEARRREEEEKQEQEEKEARRRAEEEKQKQEEKEARKREEEEKQRQEEQEEEEGGRGGEELEKEEARKKEEEGTGGGGGGGSELEDWRELKLTWNVRPESDNKQLEDWRELKLTPESDNNQLEDWRELKLTPESDNNQLEDWRELKLTWNVRPESDNSFGK